MFKTRQASTTPEQDILKVAYERQPETSRQYEPGFEDLFNQLPVMDNDNVELTLPLTKVVMKQLSDRLNHDVTRVHTKQKIGHTPPPNEFHRTIIAMEAPVNIAEAVNGSDTSKQIYKEGAELVIAKWGTGFSSPVHGHSTGYMHEEVLRGKIRVNTYRITDLENKTVVPYKTEIIGPGVFVSGYVPHNENDMYKRQTLIHNFVAVEPSISLHYLPEHTRDGRDNTFTVHHYTRRLSLDNTEVERISARDGMYLKPGEVLLVRSSNVPEYGDHFVVVTGPPVMKEHGLRIQDVSIEASENDSKFLDQFEMETGLILLKLLPATRDVFLDHHGITVKNNEVSFPKI